MVRGEMPNILVVDDDAAIGELLAEVLADAGHTARVVPGLDGLPADTAADIVVTDLVAMTEYRPDLARGWVAHVRSRFPRAAIIVCTAHRDAGQEDGRLGADAVVTKPFDLDRFLGLIEGFASR